MPEPTHETLRRVFDLVIAATPADRAGILERECRDDPGLRARVEAMMAAAEDDRFLAEPTRGEADATPTADLPASETHRTPTLREGPGSRIGPYKLLQPLGEGGFGSVFMAEQEKPVARRVALKIIKLGMDTHQVVARFEQERQALAMMDHPNIAKVFDAGATETGRPYFVMELVKGEPISEYADKQSMTVEQRLELFAQVCNAVQHAHTKGVIHRDIKPSNVLVSTQDGRPVAKVIDFGIAKATQSKLTEKTLFTEHRQLIGTPEYMSPEQAEGSLDIDTRTDVYSLGVLLYELLTSSTPFSSRQLRSAAYAEIQRIIREVDPPKPSTRLSDNTETLGRVAAQRKTEPRRLGTIVRGELDWIVMKALEKDRQRRYETASGLAADVGRYLSGEPVLAAPPSSAYRFRKFIRRHRLPVAAASMVGAALVAGVIGTTLGMQEANRARAAERERANSEAAAKLQAEKRLKQVENANDVLGAVFANLNPERIAESGRPLQAVLAESLDGAIEKLQGDETGDPLTVAKLQNTFGRSLLQLGEPAKALVLLERAAETRAKILGPDEHQTLSATNHLASALLSTRDFVRAETLARRVIKASESGGEELRGPGVTALGVLSSALFQQEKYKESVAAAKESVAANRDWKGAEHEDTAVAMTNLGFLYQQLDKSDEAVEQFEEARRIFGLTLPPEHPRRLAVLNNLASAYWNLHKLDRSIPMFEELLTAHMTSLGPDHIRTLLTTANLGVNYHGAGRYSDALPRLERVWKVTAKQPSLNFAADALLDCYLKLGQKDAARAFVPQMIAQLKATEKPGSYALADPYSKAAAFLIRAEMFVETEPLLDEMDALGPLASWRAAPLRTWVAELLAAGLLKSAEVSLEDKRRLMSRAEKLALDAVERMTPTSKSGEERRTYYVSTMRQAAAVLRARHQLEPDQGFDQRAEAWETKASEAERERKP